jgi:hypothetical protein
VRSRSEETGPLSILIEQSALKQIRQHVSQAGRGAAGLLTGDLNRCPESGLLWLSIEHASPGGGAVPDDAGADSLDGIVSPLIREQALQGQRAIGWYHVHSTLGVFLSHGEAEFHQRRFPEVWQVAVVLLDDPEHPAAGMFLRSPDGTLSRSAYVTFYERLHRSSLLPEGRKRSFVGWSNHSTGEPVVLAGSGGVPDDLLDLSEPAVPAVEEGVDLETASGSALEASNMEPTSGGCPEASLTPYGGVTPVAAGPDGEVGPSEEAHDRAQMKRALSAVDFSITVLPDPAPASPTANPQPAVADGELGAFPSSGPSGTASGAEPESPLDHGSSSAEDAGDTQPLVWERVATPSEPTLVPPSDPIGASVWQGTGSRYSKRTRVNRIVWSAFGLLVVCTLLWLVFEGGRRSVSGEPTRDEPPPAQVDRREPVVAAPVSDPPASRRAIGTASPATPGEVDLTPEIVPAPVAGVIDEPLENGPPAAGEESGPSGPTLAEASELPPIDSESADVRAEFLAALEIFDQEHTGYQERREAFARDLVGCNALNSWYRSVGDAFVRLSSKVVEAGPERASIWKTGYEDAQSKMTEIDQHYLVSECPVPR